MKDLHKVRITGIKSSKEFVSWNKCVLTKIFIKINKEIWIHDH